MAEKKTPAVSPATESAADPKTRKTAAKAPARRGRPPLAPELYVELNGKQYNITDVIDRAKADYRATHKVGVQSCKRALPTTSSTRSPANWTCNFSAFRVPRTARRSTNKTRKKRFCRTPAEAFCFLP